MWIRITRSMTKLNMIELANNIEINPKCIVRVILL